MKKKFIFVMIIATISLTGCAKTLDLSEDKANMVSEYMANQLLKYDKHFEKKLIYQVPVQEDIVGTSTNQSQETNTSDLSNQTELNQDTVISTTANEDVSDNKSDNSDSISADGVEALNEVQYVDLNTVMDSKGLEFSYTGYSLFDSYPSKSTESAVILNARKDNKLLVIEFNIKNVSTKKKTINLMDKDIFYALDSDTKEVVSELTLLPDDIHYLSTKINKKTSKKAVIIFEVTKDYKVSGANLYITNKDKTAKVNIK